MKINQHLLFMQDRSLKELTQNTNNLLSEPYARQRQMFYSEPRPKQEKRSVGYGGHEKQKLFDMESALMGHYGQNYSQLIKILIRKNYYEIKTVL